MKLAVISDIHANIEALRATLDSIAAQGVDRILCLGDLVGYNADPVACLALLRERDVFCIAGNHDRAVTGHIDVDDFSYTAARAVAWTRARLDADALDYLAGLPLKATIGRDLVLVHGALHPETGCEMIRLDSDEQRRLSFEALAAHPSGARICAFGHTHHVGVFEWRGGRMLELAGDDIVFDQDAHYLINPGSVGQPRTADRRATYLVLDTSERRIAVHRVEYDFATALAKTRRAGLLPPLSFLPAPVRSSVKWGARALGLYDPARRPSVRT